MKILITLVFVLLLAGCEEEKKADAECYFSSTQSLSTHYTDGTADSYGYDFKGNKMSGWAWAQFVKDSVSDAECRLIK